MNSELYVGETIRTLRPNSVMRPIGYAKLNECNYETHWDIELSKEPMRPIEVLSW